MNKHFLQHIQIKNFKCFDDFEADGFGRVNLIGGKNNVGKTAFMEACYINAHAQDLKSFLNGLISIKVRRENLNILCGFKEDRQQFLELSNNIFVESNYNRIFYQIEDKEGIKKYHFECSEHSLDVNVNDFSFEINKILNVEFIDNFGQANWEIISNYSSVQKKDE